MFKGSPHHVFKYDYFSFLSNNFLGYIFKSAYYSGGEWAERSVTIVRSVVKKIACNDTIIVIKLKAEPVNILIMQVYMPTSEYEDEVEKLYDTIEEILEEDGKGDTNWGLE